MLKKIIALLLILAIVIGGAVLIERRSRAKREAELMAEREKLSANLWTDDNTLDLDGDVYGLDHRMETFLFVGTDASGSGSSGKSGEHQPMADFIMLMVLDHTNNSIGFLQIDRNTVAQVDELDLKGELVMRRDLQICTAYWYGYTPEMAAANLDASVRDYLGGLQSIDGYYVINMEDIEKLNAALGGIQVTIEEDLTSRDPSFEKGKTITLSDEEAERFLRARVGLEDESNVARMGRQRQYMSGLFARVKEKTAENPEYALDLWKMLRSIASTNMSGNDFSRIAQKLLKGENMGFMTIDGESKEGMLIGDGVPHEEFYPSIKSKKEILSKLFSLVPVDVSEETPEEEEEEEESDDEEGEWIPDEPDDESDSESETETGAENVATATDLPESKEEGAA